MIFYNIVNQLQEELSEYENILPLLLKSCDRVKRLSDAYELLNYQLNQYIQAKPGPSMLIHSTSSPIQFLCKHIPSLNGLPRCGLKGLRTLSLGVDWQQR